MPSLHKPKDLSDWQKHQTLIFYDEGQMFIFADDQGQYIGFATYDDDHKDAYFLIPVTQQSLRAYEVGTLTLRDLTIETDNIVYYTADMENFREVKTEDMPDDDAVILDTSGPEMSELWEKPIRYIEKSSNM